ncbi:unnamed protein product [Musa textilis]
MRAGRILDRREAVRLDRPALHHRRCLRHLLCRGGLDGLGPQLRHALLREVHRGRRGRLRLDGRSCVLGGDLFPVLPRLPHLPPGDLHQRRHSARVRLQLLPAAPPAEVRLAFDARHRRGAFGHAGRGDSGHAGVPAVAGHARPAQGRPGGAAAGVEHEGGGGAEATGDKGGRGVDESCTDDVVEPVATHRGEGVWKELLLRPTPAVRRILIASLGIHFFEHATGIEAVVLYTPRIFKKAGISSRSKLLFVTMGMGVTKTAFILVATLLLDKVGRRPLLLTSVAGMILSLSSLGFGLTMADHSQQKLPWALGLCIVSLLLFVAFFSIGLAPVTWVYSSEIFPLRLRAQGASMGGWL